MMAILSFLFFTVLVGLITWRIVRKEDLQHSDGYFLGGRSLPWFVVAGSMMLTNISTEQLVGLNGGAYLSGVNVMGWEVIAAVALVLLALVLLPIYMRHGITTVPQLLEARYGRSVRSLFALVVMLSLLLATLPFVLYTGALSLVGLFRIEELLQVGREAAVLYMAIGLGVVGACYAVFGGLKAVAVSDSINGVGLIVGGVLVTVLGFLYLGDGSMVEALRILRTEDPEKLNAISGPDSAVPFGTLFTGMLLINISYWCLNQNIIQRTFGSRSLADGQKGVLCAGLLKVLGIFILVIPGILAWHIFDGDLPHSDMAYPSLVELVLPVWFTGFFGAVLFGAILSSFNSALHSISTLFSVDIYKTMIRKQAPETEMVIVGKSLGIVLMAVSIALVPLLHDSDVGIFELMKRVGGFMFAGSVSTVVIGLMFKRSTPVAPFVGFPLGALFFGWFVWLRDGLVYAGGDFEFRLHWLHLHGINVVLIFSVMLVIRRLIPAGEHRHEPERLVAHVDLTPWPKARLAGVGLILLVVALYALLSPIGIAR